MANITLGQVYNALKAVADWVGGTLPYKPKVVANGSHDGGGNVTPLKTDVNGNLEVKIYGTDGTNNKQVKTDSNGFLKTAVAYDNKSLQIKSFDQTSTILSGAVEYTEIKPPVGKVWRIKHFGYNVANIVGGTSGGHRLILCLSSNDSRYFELVRVDLPYTKSIMCYNGAVRQPSGANELFPDSDTARTRIVQEIEVTNSCPLFVLYSNQSNVSQTAPRSIRVIVEERDLV